MICSLLKKIIFRAASAVMCAALLLCAVPGAQAAQTEQRTVRVAFPTQGGMSEIGEGGDLVGYNYSYLQELAEYAGWKLEYITFEDQTANDGIMSAMEMVMSGEADLIGPMLGSDEAEEMFEFPQNSYGIVYTTLCTLEKSSITSVNYAKCSPLRVAVYAKASVRNQEVRDFLEQSGVEYELIECESTEEQRAMLQDGRADVLSSITLSFFDGTRAVAEFAPRPYYFVSTKGNSQLMAEMDTAIEALNYTRPQFQEQLQDEFFGDTTGGYFLTEDERKAMEELHTLNVLCAENYAPFSSRCSGGEATGLLISILSDFAAENNIEISYSFCKSEQEMEQAWATGEYDCLVGLPVTPEYCAQNGMLQTAPVLSVSMGIFEDQQTTMPYDESTVAIYGALAESTNLSSFANVLECDTLDDCFEAVDSGRADYGCANRLSIDYKLYESGSNYVSTPLLGENLDVCVTVSRYMDYHIISAMNKYIYAMSDSTKTVYLSAAAQHEDIPTLEAFVRSDPVAAAGVIAAMGVMVIGFIMFASNSRKNKKRNVELEKANAAMRQANAAKSEFLSRMSHDIRTPMNAILGFAELGKQDIGTPELLREDLERISSSGEFLLGLVNDVLDMTKIESRAMELKPEAYTKDEFKNQIETLFAPACSAKNIEFVTALDESLPECLYVDKLRFNQVFFNLLSNAVKFTPENGRIEISGKTVEEHGDRAKLRFAVKDNGIGMSEEFQTKMFDSFSQEQRHITGREGTGLGLPIVKSLVEIMNGAISVESKAGQGSTFTVELEVEVCRQPKRDESKAEAAPDSTFNGKKILLCEDHPVNTRLACRILEKGGAKVVCAGDGAEGLKLFEASGVNEFDLVLMDIRMPVMDGIEATKAIRALAREDAKTVPIIAMTANAFEDDVQQCIAAGMNAHLAKPFDVAKLYAVAAKQWRKA